MAQCYDVMTAGHVCLDVIPVLPDTGVQRIQDLLSPGKLAEIGPPVIGTGGAVSNTGIALSKLGQQVAFCARVGDDDFGRLTMNRLEAFGSTESVRIDAGQTSSYSIILAPPRIDRIVLHHPGANDAFGAADLDPRVLAQCRHFHFGYPTLLKRCYQDSGSELERIFRMAKEAGASTSCDMCLVDPTAESSRQPWPRILERCLPWIDLFLPSAEEMLCLLEPETYRERLAKAGDSDLIDHLRMEDLMRLSDRLFDLGARMTALKAGYKGLYFRTAEAGQLKPLFPEADRLHVWSGRELFCPAFVSSQYASATGAGDCAIAGLLAAFLRGMPIEQCLKVACLVGWENVQAFDAVGGVRSWEETQSLLAAGLPLYELEEDLPGWSWSAGSRLWRSLRDGRYDEA